MKLHVQIKTGIPINVQIYVGVEDTSPHVVLKRRCHFVTFLERLGQVPSTAVKQEC